MAIYTLSIPEVSLSGQAPLSIVLDHLETWGNTLVSASLASDVYTLDITPELSEEQTEHLGLAAL